MGGGVSDPPDPPWKGSLFRVTRASAYAYVYCVRWGRICLPTT